MDELRSHDWSGATLAYTVVQVHGKGNIRRRRRRLHRDQCKLPMLGRGITDAIISTLAANMPFYDIHRCVCPREVSASVLLRDCQRLERRERGGERVLREKTTEVAAHTHTRTNTRTNTQMGDEEVPRPPPPQDLGPCGRSCVAALGQKCVDKCVGVCGRLDGSTDFLPESPRAPSHFVPLSRPLFRPTHTDRPTDRTGL